MNTLYIYTQLLLNPLFQYQCLFRFLRCFSVSKKSTTPMLDHFLASFSELVEGMKGISTGNPYYK